MSLSRYLIVFVAILGISCSSSVETDKLVTISTRLGDIKLVLFEDTPFHKESFLELAEAGAYDGTGFHRVIEDFMIQAGDISKNPEFERESRRLIPAEFLSHRIHARGMLGAARQGANVNPEKKSSTQFYIVQGEVYTEEELTTNIEQLNSAFGRFLNDGEHEELKQKCLALQDSGLTEEFQNLILDMRPEIEEAMDLDFENLEITPEQIKLYTTVGGTPHLDGGYTVFGQVVEGMETVDKIASLEVDSDDKPLEPVKITLKVEEHPKDSLIAWYGIEYPIIEEED